MGLHLDEAEHASVPSNQIDFAPVVWRVKVLRDDAITLIQQVKVSLHLTAARSRKMFWLLP
jgi:hypothetical protein